MLTEYKGDPYLDYSLAKLALTTYYCHIFITFCGLAMLESLEELAEVANQLCIAETMGKLTLTTDGIG
jgi:hypothetical protein